MYDQAVMIDELNECLVRLSGPLLHFLLKIIPPVLPPKVNENGKSKTYQISKNYVGVWRIWEFR